MTILTTRDRERYAINANCRRMRTLRKRFRNDWARIYSFVHRRELSDVDRDALGAILLDGSEFQITAEDYLRFYPRICSHIICESLGYATPSKAAIILRDSVNTGVNWCEWVNACFGNNAKKVVSQSIRERHNHKGFMAEIRLARSIVDSVLKGGRGPELASWF